MVRKANVSSSKKVPRQKGHKTSSFAGFPTNRNMGKINSARESKKGVSVSFLFMFWVEEVEYEGEKWNFRLLDYSKDDGQNCQER